MIEILRTAFVATLYLFGIAAFSICAVLGFGLLVSVIRAFLEKNHD